MLLAVGIHLWGSIMAAGVAFFLHVLLLFAVAARDIGVPRGIGIVPLAIAVGCPVGLWHEVIVVSLDCSDLLDFLLGELLPGDGLGLLLWQVSLQGRNLLGVLVVKLDSLQLVGKVQALVEGVLLHLQNFISEVVVDASEEKLVLKELGHVIDAFLLYISNGSTASSPDSGHGLRPAVIQPCVSMLYADVVVVVGLDVLLDQVSKVGTDGTR